MKHEGSVQGAVFNRDESRILTWSIRRHRAGCGMPRRKRRWDRDGSTKHRVPGAVF